MDKMLAEVLKREKRQKSMSAITLAYCFFFFLYSFPFRKIFVHTTHSFKYTVQQDLKYFS